MKKIYEQLSEAFVRMDDIVLLAGMLNDGDSIADPLSDLLEEEPAQLVKCFPSMPAVVSCIEDGEDFKWEFVQWALNSNLFGFAIRFARPVMRWDSDGRGATMSWGYYNTAWRYGETLEQAIARGLEWAAEREAAEKAEACAAAASSA